jgi:hypothetical protein
LFVIINLNMRPRESNRKVSLMRRLLPFVFVLLIIVSLISPSIALAEEPESNFFTKWYDAIKGRTTGFEQAYDDSFDRQSSESGFNMGTPVRDAVSNFVAGSAGAVLETVTGELAKGVWGVSTKILAWSGTLLNMTIEQVVLGMGDKLDKVSGIKVAWKAFRDMGNILLVFILLYIGISTIIKDTGFSTKKLLGQTIIVALLLNFSYLITTLVIDVANLFTLVVNSAISSGSDIGIANAFIDPLKVQSINPQNPALGVQALAESLIMFVVYSIISLILFVVSILLIARLIILMILIMVSPIAFVASIMDGTKKSVTMVWWNTLINQAFFAPILFIFFWITILMINNENLLAKSSTWLSLFDANTFSEAVGMLLNLLIILGMLIAGVVLSRKISGGVSEQAQKVVGGISKVVGGAVIGGGAVAYRQSVARVSNNVANSDWAKRRTGFIGKGVVAGAKKAGNTSGDLRKTKSFNSVSGLLLNEKSRPFGSGAKKGYADTLKEQQKKSDAKERNFIESRSDEDYEDIYGKKEMMTDETGEERPMTYKEKAAESSVSGKIAQSTSIDSEKYPILAALKGLVVPDLPGSAAVRSAGKSRKALISNVEETGERVNELRSDTTVNESLIEETKVAEKKKTDLESDISTLESAIQSKRRGGPEVKAELLKLQTALGETVASIEDLNREIGGTTDSTNSEIDRIKKQSTGGKQSQADIIKHRLNMIYSESDSDKKNKERDALKRDIKKDIEDSSNS